MDTSPLLEQARVSLEKGRIVLPYSDAAKQAMPALVEHTWKGQRLLLAPYTDDVVRVLRNLGHALPAPIESYYRFPQGTFRSQEATAAFLAMNQRGYLVSDIGTGKTRSICFAGDWLIKRATGRRMLVVAPKSTVNPTWRQELTLHFPHLQVETLVGSKADRLKALARPADVYVINHHGVAVILDELVKRTDIEIVAIDELAIYRNPSSDLWKTMRRLLIGKKWVWGATGSPMPQSPEDVYGQAKLLTPNTVPKTRGEWKRRTMEHQSQWVWTPKKEARDLAFAALSPSIRFTRSEVVELPPCSVQDRKVPWASKDVADRYHRLATQMALMVDQGQITSANAGVAVQKLLQFSSGWVYTDKRGVFEVDIRPKLDALFDVLDSCERKVIIFVPWIHAVQGLEKHLRKAGYDIAVVTGSVAQGARDRIFANFQQSASPRILLAHPKAMAHGLTLTEADTIVWWAPIDMETYEQANGRITRPGQKHKQLIIHLTTTALERKMYRRLVDKHKAQASLLELLANRTEQEEQRYGAQ